MLSTVHFDQTLIDGQALDGLLLSGTAYFATHNSQVMLQTSTPVEGTFEVEGYLYTPGISRSARNMLRGELPGHFGTHGSEVSTAFGLTTGRGPDRRLAVAPASIDPELEHVLHLGEQEGFTYVAARRLHTPNAQKYASLLIGKPSGLSHLSLSDNGNTTVLATNDRSAFRAVTKTLDALQPSLTGPGDALSL